MHIQHNYTGRLKSDTRFNWQNIFVHSGDLLMIINIYSRHLIDNIFSCCCFVIECIILIDQKITYPIVCLVLLLTTILPI